MVWVMNHNHSLEWQEDLVLPAQVGLEFFPALEAGAPQAPDLGSPAAVPPAGEDMPALLDWQGLDLFPAGADLLHPLDPLGRLDLTVSEADTPTDIFPLVNLLPWGETSTPGTDASVYLATNEGVTLGAPGFSLTDLLVKPA